MPISVLRYLLDKAQCFGLEFSLQPKVGKSFKTNNFKSRLPHVMAVIWPILVRTFSDLCNPTGGAKDKTCALT